MRLLSALTVCALLAAPHAATAAEQWWSGDWYLKLGAAGFAAPRYEGSKDYMFQATPMISLGKAGNVVSQRASRSQSTSHASSGVTEAGVGLLGAGSVGAGTKPPFSCRPS